MTTLQASAQRRLIDEIDAHSLTVAMFIEHWSAIECWRVVPGWSEYEVSSFGKVLGPRGLLTPSITHGYQIVSLVKDSETTNRRVHQLVLEAFVGPAPFADAEAAHNDGTKSNNRINNLRWATARDNQADRRRHATAIFGSRVGQAKLTEAQIPDIYRRAISGEKYKQIAADFGVTISTVSLIKRGIVWNHVTKALAEKRNDTQQ